MNNDRKKELLKQLADKFEEEKQESILNPLSAYSTTQLKAELRRRKGK